MKPWQIKALDLEASALKSIDGIISDYGPYLFIGVVVLLMTFGIWVLSGGLRRKLLNGKPMPQVQHVIFVYLRGPPPSATSDPFPPPHHYRHDACDEHWD